MLKELDKREENSYICSIMAYIGKAGKTKHPEEIEQIVKDLKLANEEKIMGTLAEYWAPKLVEMVAEKRAAEAAKIAAKVAAEKATKKALIKGRHEQAIETAKELFLQGIDLNIISSATKLSKKEIRKLAS